MRKLTCWFGAYTKTSKFSYNQDKYILWATYMQTLVCKRQKKAKKTNFGLNIMHEQLYWQHVTKLQDCDVQWTVLFSFFVTNDLKPMREWTKKRASKSLDRQAEKKDKYKLSVGDRQTLDLATPTLCEKRGVIILLSAKKAQWQSWKILCPISLYKWRWKTWCLSNCLSHVWVVTSRLTLYSFFMCISIQSFKVELWTSLMISFFYSSFEWTLDKCIILFWEISHLKKTEGGSWVEKVLRKLYLHKDPQVI